MPGLRRFLRQLNETRREKERLFANEQARLAKRYTEKGHNVIARSPSKELLGLIDTRQELQTAARTLTRPL